MPKISYKVFIDGEKKTLKPDEVLKSLEIVLAICNANDREQHYLQVVTDGLESLQRQVMYDSKG